jgi:hypothetical protein
MVMPRANDVIAVACFVLLAAFAVWTLIEVKRTRSAVPMLILIGGMLTAIVEPILDHVGAIWYPQIGSTAVFRAFNISLPIWAIAAYGLYVGALSSLIYRKMSGGMTARQLWIIYFSIWVFSLGLELPGLNFGIYRYYGDQPFNIFGFPLWWAMTNVTIPVLSAAVLNGYQQLLVGARSVLILALLPMIGAAGEAASGWPMWLALNSAVGPEVKLVAGFMTLGMSMLIVYLVSLKFCKPSA